MLEQIIVSILGRFSANDLKKAIEKNISLAVLLKQYGKDILAVVRQFRFMYKEHLDQFNVYNTLKWLKVKRKDLYDVFISDIKSYKWLEKQIEDIKKLL